MADVEELRRKLLKSAREMVRERYSERDVHIIKAVNLLDDLDAAFNLLAEQIREWYGFHFPELAEIVRDNEKYLRLVYEIGERRNFCGEGAAKKIAGFYDNAEAAEKITGKAGVSLGSEIEGSDISEIRLLALNALNLRDARNYLTKYLEGAMQKEMPNFSSVAGHVLGARILGRAGGMRRLAFRPSSTIQLLGAEKALFRHLREGAKGPKYGLIYAHPLVRAANPWDRGKVARALAGKLAIAAREDYFGKKDISKALNEELRKRVSALRGSRPKARSGRFPADGKLPAKAGGMKTAEPCKGGKKHKRFRR